MNTPDAVSTGRPDAGSTSALSVSAERSSRDVLPRSDTERIDHILITMRRALGQLEGVGPVDACLLEQNSTAGLVIERVLANLTEMAFDINSHVARAMAGLTPVTFSESCEYAVRFGLVDDELAAALMPADGPYHVAMQLYLDTEPAQVESVVASALSAFQEFERRTIAWAGEHTAEAAAH